MISRAYRWVDRNILELGREMRLSYLPPLMVYLAAGVSGLTAIVGTFFVKDYLGLSAEFLAALGFWAGIPWALKMPLGHLVDLIWRFKSALVFVGAGLITISLLIMIGLLDHTAAMREVMPAETWYIVSVLLAPIGYVVQDVVADAMTVEAVPRVDTEGTPFDDTQRKLMHTTMQTLGRVAIVGGGILVAVVNILMFSGVEAMPEAEKVRVYSDIYTLALAIPAISVFGVVLGGVLKLRDMRRLYRKGFERRQVHDMVLGRVDPTSPNWWILGGSLVFAIFTLTMGISQVPFAQEIIFVGSMAIILFLMYRLLLELEPEAR